MRFTIGFVGIALVLTGALAAAQTEQPKAGETEAEALRALNIKTDDESLLDYLRARTLKDVDRVFLTKLVKELDSDKYQVRVQAAKALLDCGRVALPFLKKGLQDAPLELVQRARECIKEIEKQTASEPTATVARLLAARQVPAAIDVLFDFLPNVEDPYTEEEILAALGTLAVRGDKIDKRLTAALQHPQVDRRGAAAFILADRGGLAHRDAIRQLLADPDPLIRERAAAGLLGKQLFQQGHDSLVSDLATLQAAKVDCQGPALLDYLAKRTLAEDDQKRLKKLIEDLGHKSFPLREKATQALIDEGMPALPFLKLALEDADQETVNRAKLCIGKIKVSTPPAIPSAVVRILSLAGDERGRKTHPIAGKNDPRDLKPAKVVKTLLDFLPFADDDALEDEIINTLLVLSTRGGKTEPALVEALNDPLPARRAAAAVVLGKTGSPEQIQAVRAALEDILPKVQFRAAQGLLAAQEKAAVPRLIDLLAVASDKWLWQVDEQLSRLAAGNPPTIAVADNTADYRKKARAAWSAWWTANEKTLDLSAVKRGEAMLGVFVITEYDNMQAGIQRQQGRVWECGRDGKPRWEISNLQGAIDSHVLPGGRVLVSEANTQKITERDLRGNVTWTFNTPGLAVAVKRLPNGNTFICTYDRVLEVTPAGQTVVNCAKNPQYVMYGACRMKNGHVAAITSQGQIVIFDPVGNRDIKTISVGNPSGWAGIDVLPNGHFLIAHQSISQVREIDDTGKVHWQANFPGAFRAVKLPNGNVLVSSMTTRRVAELDRAGAEVWGVTCNGRPWSVKYR